MWLIVIYYKGSLDYLTRTTSFFLKIFIRSYADMGRGINLSPSLSGHAHNVLRFDRNHVRHVIITQFTRKQQVCNAIA
jgi:hypothetical protein